VKQGAYGVDLNELAYRAARLYYLEGLTQQQIASQLGISRSKVSRLLAYAREVGMVEIKLKAPGIRSERFLSDFLKERLGLKEVVVAEATERDEEHILEKIAKAGSEYISKVLKNGQIVGWGWGRTMYKTVHALRNDGEPHFSSIFIPLIGGAGQSARHYQVNSLVERAAEIFKAQVMYLNAPAFFADKNTLELFLKEKQVSNVLEMWKKLDIAIFGLGKPVYDSEIIRSEIDSSIIMDLLREKAVGDILARFFNPSGKICSSTLNELIFGIGMDDLLKVPTRICLCGGEKKVDGIITASKEGYLNVLVIDSITANTVLNRLKGE